VLDTCVIVAAIKSKSGASFILVDAASVRNKFFECVLSNSLISEYEEVIHRPEHRLKNWTNSDLAALVDSLLVPAYWAPTDFLCRPLLRDADDELVLEAAVNGQADLIVTFNVKHFGPAGRFGVKVVTPGQLLEILKKRGFVYGEK
jgi:putative PIN family toxin of toxin-antitoxin system